VLSVSRRLTVWCRGEVVWWQEPEGAYDRLPVTDLVEAAERIVCAHEDLIAARAPDLAAARDLGADQGPD